MTDKLKRNIRLLSLFNFFNDFVFFAPVAIIYFARVTGSITLGMSIFSVAYISSAIFEIPTGIISDFVGRKKTMILGTIFSIICIVFYAIGGNYWIMMVGAISQGLSRSFFSGNNNAFLHDLLKEAGLEKEYHSYLGKTGSLFQVALASASIIGGIIASISLSLSVYLSVIPQICCLVIVLFMDELSITSKESGNIFIHIKDSLYHFKNNYKLRLLTITSSLRFAVLESKYFLESAFVNLLWPIWAVGVYSMFKHIFGALSFYFSGRVINKYNPLKVLSFEIIYGRIVNLTCLIFPTIISPALMSTTSLTFGVGTVATNSLLQKEFTEHQRATMGSLNSLIGSISFGIFSVTIGFLADKIGIINALIIANVIVFIPLYYYRKIFLHEKIGSK